MLRQVNRRKARWLEAQSRRNMRILAIRKGLVKRQRHALLFIFPDRWIPLFLLPIGIAGAVALIGCCWEAVVQGVLVTGTAVYGNQIVKQINKRS